MLLVKLQHSQGTMLMYHIPLDLALLPIPKGNIHEQIACTGIPLDRLNQLDLVLPAGQFGHPAADLLGVFGGIVGGGETAAFGLGGGCGGGRF